jgi:hypothetical protein
MLGSSTTKMERKWKLQLPNKLDNSFTPTTFESTDPPQPIVG